MQESLEFYFKKLMQNMSQIQNKNTSVTSDLLFHIFLILDLGGYRCREPHGGAMNSPDHCCGNDIKFNITFGMDCIPNPGNGKSFREVESLQTRTPNGWALPGTHLLPTGSEWGFGSTPSHSDTSSTQSLNVRFILILPLRINQIKGVRVT